ncbi:beta-galactosidase [Gorillibacterium sp. sgz5001074]|uniref:beta-galactosidase n=1 Tax=Gorillibacterium sp. sgz5001074 TaxID=3446695 RepID=UPI003F66F924
MANKLYHGVAWYPELWEEAVLEQDLALMKEAGINVVRIGEFAWSAMEPEEGKIDVGFFVQIVERLHREGIGTVLCTPTPTPPIWFTHSHPERMYRDDQGRVMGHGARQHPCTNHPVFREKAARITEELARALGAHPGLMGWQLDNEFKSHVSECMCETCLKLWHQWLEARYVTVERLNDAWGTGIWSGSYQRFDQVPQPGITPFLHSSSLRTQYRKFSMEKIAEFAGEQAAIIRRYSRAPITHNSSIAFHLDNEQLFRNLDFASYDTYASFENQHAYLINCDYWRNMKQGRDFWIMETSPSHAGSIESSGVPHPNGYVKAEAAAAYALGGEAFCYWLWRQQRAGCEQTHGSVLSSWGAPSIGYRSVLEVEEARRTLEPILLSTRPARAETAMTYSDRAKAFLRTEPHRKLNHRGLVTDFYARLLSMNLHRDVLPEGADLAGCRLLFTPYVPYLSREYMDRAERFVAEGGIWIVGPLSGGRTEEHTFHTDAGLGERLERFAGVRTAFTYPMDGSGTVGRAFGVEAPLTLWSSVFQPVEATAVGVLEGGPSPGLAFLTERTVGSRGGKVVLLGSLPGGEAGDRLLRSMIDRYAGEAGVRQRTDATAGTIVAPRVDRDGRSVWVAVNMNGAGGTVTLPSGGMDLLSGDGLEAGTVLRVEPFGYRAVRLES